MAEGAQAALLIDENGNFVGVLHDGSIYRIQTTGKVQNASGTQVDPATEGKQDDAITKLTSLDGKDFATQTTLATLATESKLEAVRTLLVTIDADTSNLDVALSTRATEATLLAADGRLTTIDAVLDSIKDTDGIKKITDQLPAGTNEIGKVAQGTKAAAADGWPLVLYDASGNPVPVTPNTSIPASNKALLAAGEDPAGTSRLLQTEVGGELKEVLYDANGNPVGVVLDGSLYRLQTDSKVAKGSSALVTLDAIDTTSGQGRLKATLYTPDGDPVAFGATSSSLKNDYVESGGSSDLRVDGSTTPVTFSYLADSTYDISLQEIKFTMVANGITFGNNYFGSTSGPLTNGLSVQVVSGGDTIDLFTLEVNEHFINFASPGGWEWIVSNKDVMTSAYLIGGGVKLYAGTGDQVKVTVQDDISSCGLYFECFVKGNLLTEV